MSITTITTRITVDMAGGDVKRYAVKAKQYDRATRVVAVSLLWDGAPYNVGDNSVRCNVHKPDGTIAIIDGGNVNVEDNTVYVSLIGAALTAAGRAWADIEIETQDESQQISCQCFEIDIARSPVDDDSIISTNEFSAMKAATKAANDAAAAALAEIDATAAAGAAANQAAAAAQAATDAANQAAAAATASIQIDTTLTDNSKAAPAGMVGEIKEDLSQKAGLSEEAKQALLACFAKVAWVDEHGQDYYDALEDALYPPVELVRISCVYTQSKTVYYASSLNELKSDLIVTAYMSDGTTRTITDYELSGTLTVGTSVITVTHGGKVATFSVTVTQPPYTWRYSASSGDLLSEESYFESVTTGETCTEELINGVLKLTSVASANQYALRYYLTPTTNNHAAIKFRIRYVAIPIAIGASGFRVVLSDGSKGSRIGVRKHKTADKYELVARAGTTDTDIAEIELNTWYEVLLEKNGQNTVVTLDGTEVYNSNNPSTSYTTENQIFNQSTGETTSVVDIDYIEYHNYDIEE